MQKELSSMIEKIRKWILKNKVIDIIVFGSHARGKSEPSDIDICILINDYDEKKSLNLIDSLGKLTDNFKLKFHITLLTSSAFTSGNTLVKTLLSEGYSIKHNENLSHIFGFENKSLFVYTLKNFSSSKRVRFHYLLKGRYGSQGILQEAKGKFLSIGSILVPVEKEDMMKQIFDEWNVKYSIHKILFS